MCQPTVIVDLLILFFSVLRTKTTQLYLTNKTVGLGSGKDSNLGSTTQRNTKGRLIFGGSNQSSHTSEPGVCYICP